MTARFLKEWNVKIFLLVGSVAWNVHVSRFLLEFDASADQPISNKNPARHFVEDVVVR